MKHNTEVKIEQKQKRLYLIEFHAGKKHMTKKDKVCITVSRKFGMLSFGSHAIQMLNMKGKWIKLAFDAGNKVIAWRLKETLNQNEMKSGWKLVKQNKSGQFQLFVEAILKQMIGLTKDSYKKLEVKKYKDYSLLQSDDYYFVEIK